MIRACIFDMDGLLLDSEHIWFRVNKAFLARRGCEYNLEMRRAVLGRRERETTETLARACGISEPLESLVKERKAVMLQEFRSAPDLRLMPGARELLESLKGKFPLALASSSPRELVEIAVGRTDIAGYFSVIVAGEDVPNGKPSPDPFLLAAQRLNVPPADCLVFEDAPNGVAAAKAAGMRCVAVCHAHSPREHLRDADLVLDSLAEFSFERFPSGT